MWFAAGRNTWRIAAPATSGVIAAGAQYTAIWNTAIFCEGRSISVDIAREYRVYKWVKWKANQLRYYQIAGITIRETADFPFSDSTFIDSIEQFRLEDPW